MSLNEVLLEFTSKNRKKNESEKHKYFKSKYF